MKSCIDPREPEFKNKKAAIALAVVTSAVAAFLVLGRAPVPTAFKDYDSHNIEQFTPQIIAYTPSLKPLNRQDLRTYSISELHEASCNTGAEIIYRQGMLTCRRRFLSPSDDHDLTYATIRDGVQEFNSITGTLADVLSQRDFILAKRAFFKSFSSRQRLLGRNGALNLSDLTKSQVRQWNKINRTFYYGGSKHFSGKAVAFLNGWNVLKIGLRTDGLKTFVTVRTSTETIDFPLDELAEPPSSARKSGVDFGRVFAAPEPKFDHRVFDRRIQMASRPWRVSEIVAFVSRECGIRIDLDAGADEIVGIETFGSVPASYVLTGVTDLTGLKVKKTRRGWILSRATSLLELNTVIDEFFALRQALPPVLLMCWSREASPSRSHREARRLRSLADHLQRNTMPGASIPVRTLPPDLQDSLSFLIVNHFCRIPCGKRFSDALAPPAWLSSPHLGKFLIVQDHRSPLNPWLYFQVRKGIDKPEFWGWKVGTGHIGE